MDFIWFSSILVSVWKFHNFFAGSNSAELLNYFFRPLCFNIKHFKDPNSSSFIRVQCILHDSEVLLSFFESFLKLKRRDLISWGEEILQNDWFNWYPLLYFNIKHLKEPNSLSFIRFQCGVHDSALLLSVLWKFPQNKEGGPNFLWGTNSAERLKNLVSLSAFQC